MRSLVTMPANATDSSQLPQLPHGTAKALFDVQAHWDAFHRECAKQAAMRYPVKRRGTANKPLTEH